MEGSIAGWKDLHDERPSDLALVSHHAAHSLRQLAQAERVPCQLHLASFDLTDVKHRVEQAQHVVRHAQDLRLQLPTFRRGRLEEGDQTCVSLNG